MSTARKFSTPPKDRVPSSSFFEPALDVQITGGTFTVVDGDNNITHFGNTTTFRFDEPPPEEQSPPVFNVNCGNVNETRLENVANQNLHLHLHYTEIYSTPKDGGEPIRTEKFDYDMGPGSPDSNERGHKHSLDGVFSHAINVAGKSKKSRELKKSFKSLLGLLQDDLACPSSSTITQEEDSSSDSTEYFFARDDPLSAPSRTSRPCVNRLGHSDNPKSYTESLQDSPWKETVDSPWKETVHDFVNSVTAMSRRATGVYESDASPDPAAAARTVLPLPQPPLEALSSLSTSQSPVYHPALADIVRDAVSEAVKQQFAALHIDNAASISNPISTTHARQTARRRSISLRPSISATVYRNGTWDGRGARSGLEGIWSGQLVCDYREVKARIPGGRNPAIPVIKERTMGRFVMPLDSRSPVGAVEDQIPLQPRRQIKRPRLAHQRTLDGYDADGDDSEGG